MLAHWERRCRGVNIPCYHYKMLAVLESQACQTPMYIQVIEVTNVDGILLCGIAASGTNSPTTATFYGITKSGTNISTTAGLPVYTSYANVTMGNAWQPLQSISIVTTGKLHALSVTLALTPGTLYALRHRCCANFNE